MGYIANQSASLIFRIFKVLCLDVFASGILKVLIEVIITIYKQRLNGRDRDDSGAFISKRTTLTKLPVTLCGESVSSIIRSLSIVFRLHFAKVKGRSDPFSFFPLTHDVKPCLKFS